MPAFRYQPDLGSTLSPWRDRLGEEFDSVVTRLTDRDRQLEDYVSRLDDDVADLEADVSRMPKTFFYSGGIGNGTATGFTAFLTQNAVGSLSVPYTMFVDATLAHGANGAANLAAFQVQNQAGTNINFKAIHMDVVTHWYVKQNFTGNASRIVTRIVGGTNYAAGAVCGFRLAYLVDTSNIYIDAGVRVDLVPV